MIEEIHKIFYKSCEGIKTDLKTKNERLIGDGILLQNKLKICNDNNIALREIINKPINESDEAKFWNNNYPKANISYNGRRIPNVDGAIGVDVRLFITPNDFFIKSEIDRFNLNVKNPLKCNTDILKIFKFCRKDSKYHSDNKVVGFPEYWMFPFEFKFLNKNGDCDDNSHYIVSYLIAAGVPEFRVRVVVGMTSSNFGHSTVYVLGDDLETWYHINSTGGKEKLKKLTDFPTSKDCNSDSIGIKDVWFSFNSKYAWHVFKTESSAKSFDSEKLPILIENV